MTRTYRLIRAVLSIALRWFFRFESVSDLSGALALPGSVIFVANHPNGLIDPAIVLTLVQRQVTFLSKAPLFQLPVLGSLLRALEALPVYRKQDAGANMSQNDATLKTAATALVDGRALMLFPEGKSHSDPHMSPLKTGCARIACDAVRQLKSASKSTPVNIVPIGLVYQDKASFRSAIRVEVGVPFAVEPFEQSASSIESDVVMALTAAIDSALRKVTVNLEAWEDLPIIETAAALYALKEEPHESRLEEQRVFARGMALLRSQAPEQFESLKSRLVSFRHRLGLLQLKPGDLTQHIPLPTVLLFVGRNMLWLLGLPVFLFGLALFWIPYWVPWFFGRRAELDVQSTVKLLVTLVWAPVVWAALVALAFFLFGGFSGLGAFFAVPALALFTLVFYERRAAALSNVRTFLTLASQRALRTRLVDEGESLATEIVRLAKKLA